ncbi:GNAT family N-acetyltransferase [Demetria terragena]|uniref:GNAT family N-acetyltransferase n=1 Tax=Demetria terragena TaxID=63959 RepID=UPI0003636AA2|nr:GNAT family N-acetyltransferase [Demetria terragena]
MTAIQLTRLGTADLTPQVSETLTEIFGDLVCADAAIGWTEPPTLRETTALLQEVTAPGPEDACALLAWLDGSVAGFGYWTRYIRPTHRPHADLGKLVVSPPHSRRGVGRAMVRALVARARSAGIEQLTLDFRGDNTRAESLYLSEGFVEYGRLAEFVAPSDGRRLDKVFHVLDLR